MEFCCFSKTNDALEIHCSYLDKFIYHIDRSVDWPLPDDCPYKNERIACDQVD
jgi:hypothetical protein